MRSWITVGVVVASVVVLALPAWAITNGQPDDGKHPNVGALVAGFAVDGEQLYFAICSGTLLKDSVFLTAGHCVTDLDSFLPPGFELFVSFEDDAGNIDPNDLIEVAETAAHPAYDGFGGDPKNVDLAVAVLEQAPANVIPAALPAIGLVDRLSRAQRLTAVGYGLSRDDAKRKGPQSRSFDGVRRFAEQGITHANASWLKLTMNPATGNAGTCNGDSGGPHFLGTGTETAPGIVVSVTSWGDRYCRATDWTARVDTERAQAFIRSYMSG